MSAETSPIEWKWNHEAAPDPVFSPGFLPGNYCYGNSEPPPPSNRNLEFRDGTLTISVGRRVSPAVSYTGRDGVVDLGNPFGEEAWVCSVASDGTAALAVGSDVWWSDDGTAWNVIEAFADFGGPGPYLDESSLVWSAAGPLGYVVLGRRNDAGWYSPDLETWYRIPVEDGPGYEERGWLGPGNATITGEAITIGSGAKSGAWVGTPSN